MNNNGLERITFTAPLTNGAPEKHLTLPSLSQKQNGLREEVERLQLEVEHLRDQQKALQRTPASDDLESDKIEHHGGDDSNARDPAGRRSILHRRSVKLVLALVVFAILSVGGPRFWNYRQSYE